MELVCEQLGKHYGTIWAVHDVTLRAGSGIIGLVGPNGAGKTTLMRMIATLLVQTKGSITWNGHDTRTHGAEVRQVLGYLPQDFGLYPEFSGRQFLRYIATMKGLPRGVMQKRVDEMLELVNLESVASRKLRTYSGGMRQRIGIAQALLNDPSLLIVDEPTVGLDPEERVRFRTLLATLNTDRLIILSTHIISDVEAIANRVIIMNKGQIHTDTTPEDLLREAEGHVWTVVADAATAARLQTQHQLTALVNHRDGIQLRIVSATRPTENAVLVEPNLEDAYMMTVRGQKAVLTV